MKDLIQVIVQDEWNNLYEIGFYSDLEMALPDINQFLKVYDVEIESGMLSISAGTMGPVFDTNLGDLFPDREDELSGISVRGFVHDFDEVMKRLEELENPYEKVDDWVTFHDPRVAAAKKRGW